MSGKSCSLARAGEKLLTPDFPKKTDGPLFQFRPAGEGRRRYCSDHRRALAAEEIAIVEGQELRRQVRSTVRSGSDHRSDLWTPMESIGLQKSETPEIGVSEDGSQNVWISTPLWPDNRN